MSEAIRLLHALAHALATIALYSPGHPATRRAIEQAHQALLALLDVDPRPSFLFLNTSAVYAGRALHELREWPWTQRLSDAALQRVSFDSRLTVEGMSAFLDLVTMRVATGDISTEAAPIDGVVFGAVSVLDDDAAEADSEDEVVVEGSAELQVELDDELDVVTYIFSEAARGALARAESEAVVRILDGLLEQHPLPQAAAANAPYSAAHAVNTSLLAMACATASGMDRVARQRIGLAALLHDLGMALVPTELTSKDSLTSEERAKVEAHTVRGARLLLEGGQGMALSATVAYEHHHRPDGTGYPVGRMRVSPHWASRLVGVTSAYVALRAPRPFRPAWTPDRALRHLEDGAGTVFDGDIARMVAVLVRPT